MSKLRVQEFGTQDALLYRSDIAVIKWQFCRIATYNPLKSFLQVWMPGDPELAPKPRQLIIFGEKKKASKLKLGKNDIP